LKFAQFSLCCQQQCGVMMMAQDGCVARVALVTGAGAGIGRAVALKLAAGGWTVVLAGRRLALLEQTAALANAGACLMCCAADVADPHSVAALFSKSRDAYGRLDLLFNNAGQYGPALPIEDVTYDQWRAVVDVNLTGAFLCAQAAIRLMKAQTPRGGRIINNGSISAHVPRPMSAPYTATKHAITGLTRSIALDGRAFDIACSQIDIGNAATSMTDAFAAGVLQADGTRMQEPRMDVAHVADAVALIAGLPLSANVPFMTLMATTMPYIGRG
jgi:NAD(P)-dependent dehydrogenase (short-subunit alcohol dehydrogenase family)